MAYKILIACSDDRKDILAKLLKHPRLKVYLVIKKKIYLLNEHGPKEMDEKDWPKHFDCLFFHNGMGDPSMVPENTAFDFEFVFSTAGFENKSDSILRSEAKPIKEPFTQLHCPVQPYHVNQLINLLDKRTSALPDFCNKAHVAAAKLSLSILLQNAMLITAIGLNEDRNSNIFKETGWAMLPLETQYVFEDRCRKIFPQVNNAAWWVKILGFEPKAAIHRDDFAVDMVSVNSFRESLTEEFAGYGVAALPEPAATFFQHLADGSTIDHQLIKNLWLSVK